MNAAKRHTLWDNADVREGYYALLLAVTQAIRPEQAFALLRQEAAEVTAQDCEDIEALRYRRVSIKELAGMYGCSREEIRRALRLRRGRESYRLSKDEGGRTVCLKVEH